MYHDFFGVKEAAFSIAVNPRYLYMSDQHREALAHLVYGIQHGGFVMLTGEVGTGKTTIIRCLLEQLPANTDIAIILNPMASAPELLSTICDELGANYIEDNVGIKELTDALQHFLLDNHRKGRRTVLLIDEAQLLKVPVLEQIRLLTNLETTTEKLLQIMLVGQPELKKLLARPALRQLSQRITARFHLNALSLIETHAYIAHRLQVAGMPNHLQPFDEKIIKRIHDFSGGIPRLVNILCERLLLGAYGKNTHRIDGAIFDQAIVEVSGTAVQPSPSPRTFNFTGIYPSVIAVMFVVMLWMAWRILPNTQVSLANNHLASSVASQSLPVVSQSSYAINTSSSPSADPAAVIKFSLRDVSAAHIALFNYVGVATNNFKNLCGSIEEQHYRCEKVTLNSWDEIKDINRPALLTLAAPDKKWVYALMIGLSEHEVLLLANGAIEKVRWVDVAASWTGDLVYVWSRPVGFETTVALGDQGDQVTWLAEQFARLDNQPAPLTRHFFTEKLKKRVEIFQASQKIVPDGVVGAQTLRRLNEALGVEKTLVPVEEFTAVSSKASSSVGSTQEQP